MPNDINTQITRITGNVAAAYSAALAKGATMPQTQDSDHLADTVATIPEGGGAYNVTSVSNSDGTQTLNITDAGGSGGGKAAQASDTMGRVNTTTLSASSVRLTVEKTGTYTVRWFAYRTSTSGTSGTRLYIGSTAYGSENTTFGVNSNGQTNKLTGVSLTAGQTITVYARSRNTSYYTFVMGLSIMEE